MKSFLKTSLILFFCFAFTMTASCSKIKPKLYKLLGKEIKSAASVNEEPKGGADLVFLKEDLNIKTYENIMIDYVIFHYNDYAEYKGIQADELNELAKEFHLAVKKEIGHSYSVVDKPGKRVIRLRTSISNLMPEEPGINNITSVIHRNQNTVIRRISEITHADFEHAEIEIEFLDSMTHERLALARDNRPEIPLEGITKWKASTKVFNFWAKRVLLWLNKMHSN